MQRTGAQYSGSVSIEVPYVVHVNFPGYPIDLHFDPAATNKGHILDRKPGRHAKRSRIH